MDAYEWQRCRPVEAILSVLLSVGGRGQGLVDLHSDLNLLNIAPCCSLPCARNPSITPHQPRMQPHLLSRTYTARRIMAIGHRLGSHILPSVVSLELTSEPSSVQDDTKTCTPHPRTNASFAGARHCYGDNVQDESITSSTTVIATGIYSDVFRDRWSLLGMRATHASSSVNGTLCVLAHLNRHPKMRAHRPTARHAILKLSPLCTKTVLVCVLFA